MYQNKKKNKYFLISLLAVGVQIRNPELHLYKFTLHHGTKTSLMYYPTA